MTAQSIVGPRSEVFDNKSLKGSWISEFEEEELRRGDSTFDECVSVSVSSQIRSLS